MRCASGSTPHADNCTDDSQGMLQPGTFSLSLSSPSPFLKRTTVQLYETPRTMFTVRPEGFQRFVQTCALHTTRSHAPTTGSSPNLFNSFPHFRLSRKKRNEFLLPIHSNINSAPIFTCLAPFPPTTLAFANRTGMISSYAGFWDALQVDPYAGTQCKLELNIIYKNASLKNKKLV